MSLLKRSNLQISLGITILLVNPPTRTTHPRKRSVACLLLLCTLLHVAQGVECLVAELTEVAKIALLLHLSTGLALGLGRVVVLLLA